MERKAAAKQLFLEGWPQNRIASAFKVSEQTVNSWKKKGNWEQKRSEYGLQRETAEESVWELINYQLKVLKRMKEDWEKEDKPKLIERGDIDALQKLFVAIKGKQQTWTGYVNVMREFVEWYQEKDINAAKMILDSIDEFLNDKRRELK